MCMLAVRVITNEKWIMLNWIVDNMTFGQEYYIRSEMMNVVRL